MFIFLKNLNTGYMYIGYTSNIRKRVLFHNDGLVRSTKHKRPLKLIFFEAYKSKYDALRREKYLKSTRGRTTLRYMLKEYLNIYE